MSGILVRLTLSSGARILQCCRLSDRAVRSQVKLFNTEEYYLFHGGHGGVESLMIRSSPSSGKD